MAVSDPEWTAKVSDSQRIWRYISYPKFLHLLDAKCLYFARLNRMSDLFEGHLPRISVEAWGEEVDSTPGNAMPGAMMPGATPEWGRHHLGEEAARRARETFINCWHMNDVESEAMWVLYGGRGASVAITSTYGSLCEAVTWPGSIMIGAVKYQRFDSEHVSSSNFFAPVFHKRKSFEHEHELRAAIHTPNGDGGNDHLLVPVKLDKLIHSVRLAPTTPPTIASAVRGILAKYGLADVPLGSSVLDKRPDYD